jgi:hypothetical protein
MISTINLSLISFHVYPDVVTSHMVYRIDYGPLRVVT